MRRAAARALLSALALLSSRLQEARAETQPVSPTPETLANQVHAIFRARCMDCHGADLARPKGKFGYVLDLARVAANPKMVVPGSPALSELYQMVSHNEMPPPEAHLPTLTAQEKEIVKSWIEAGAPAPPPSGNETKTPPLTLGRRILRDVGQFHPPSTHFPIALLLVAVPAEFMWMLTRKESWKATVRFCVMLGALTVVTTATLGWCDAPFSSAAASSASTLLWHRWVGTATAVWAGLVATLSEFSNRRGNSGTLSCYFRLTLVIGAALVSAAGYLGASVIYGLNHFSW